MQLLMQPLASIHPGPPSHITVCTRPFRAQGPRIEAERLGSKLLVHNYGHGGSGWSLSWGSATAAMQLAFADTGTSPAGRPVAVIGCGALGLTLATLLQQAGAHVTIYARDQPQQTRSFRATGAWTPDSRVALAKSLPSTFAHHWQHMARISWHRYAQYLAKPSHPVEFTPRYILSDLPPDEAEAAYLAADPIGFAHLRPAIADLHPELQDFPPGTHPFPTRYARRVPQLTFNITQLVHLLTTDFLQAGGHLETRTFLTPADLLQLPQPTLFNCTGYGARALFADESIIPVRGQIAWLPPQPTCNYSILRGPLNLVCRRDGIVLQLSAQGEATGYQDPNELPDPHEAEQALRHFRYLYKQP